MIQGSKVWVDASAPDIGRQVIETLGRLNRLVIEMVADKIHYRAKSCLVLSYNATRMVWEA